MNFVARGRKLFAGKECKCFDPRRIVDTLRIETRSMTRPAGDLRHRSRWFMNNSGLAPSTLTLHKFEQEATEVTEMFWLCFLRLPCCLARINYLLD